MTNGELEPVRLTTIVVVYGLSAHCGSGGLRMTGQVGPSETVPRTPDVYGKMLFPVGHGVNSQFGPVRRAAEPSGQIFASIVHACSVGACTMRVLTIHNPPMTITTGMPMIAYLFMVLVYLFSVSSMIRYKRSFGG